MAPSSRGRNYQPIENWKRREKLVDKRGYVRVRVPEHPRSFSGGWTYEHRLVMERAWGRVLKRGEQVHHINENKQDNREDNLFVCRSFEHQKAHDQKHIIR